MPCLQKTETVNIQGHGWVMEVTESGVGREIGLAEGIPSPCGTWMDPPLMPPRRSGTM